MNYKPTILKLQTGINRTGVFNVLVNTSQFYSKTQRRPVNVYVIKLATYDAENDTMKSKEVFRTGEQVQVVFFLRNLLYLSRGETIPLTNHKNFDNEWQKFTETTLGDM